MFTGIVTAIGTIESVAQHDDMRLRIACPFDPESMAIGASINCSGVCLTVVERGGEEGDAWFGVDVSNETVSRTAQGMWSSGREINLEQALKLGDELGGHLVTGHVDAVGRIVKAQEEGGSIRIEVLAPESMAPYVAEKGSVTIDGVSLTVNLVDDEAGGDVRFGVNIIPHTGDVTTLGQLAEGDAVNLEIDVLARYLKRMESLRAS